MPILLTGALLSVLPYLLHWALWRIYLPRRQTRALVLITVAADALLLLGLAWQQGSLSSGVAAADAPPPLVYLHIALFMFATLCAYVITYTALEADSPTIVMVKMLDEAGPDGLAVETFHSRLNDDMLVLPRVCDLLRDHMAREVDGCYVMTPKGRFMAAVFGGFARLLGIGLGG